MKQQKKHRNTATTKAVWDPRTALTAEFEQILRQDRGALDELKARNLEPADIIDQAQKNTSMELSRLLHNGNKRKAKEIQQAYQRLANGTYGVCIECHEEIRLKRLAAVPWTKHCTQCAENEEEGIRTIATSA